MGEMLPLETKQSGGKLLPHLDLRGGVSLEEVSCHRKGKRDTLLGMWNVRSLYRAGSLMAVANPRGRDRWGDPGVDGRITLGWTFRRWD
jgi:hypothetical protein